MIVTHDADGRVAAFSTKAGRVIWFPR
jgi:hypothetical protein